jgi:hypothetical protein
MTPILNYLVSGEQLPRHQEPSTYRTPFDGPSTDTTRSTLSLVRTMPGVQLGSVTPPVASRDRVRCTAPS